MGKMTMGGGVLIFPACCGLTEAGLAATFRSQVSNHPKPRIARQTPPVFPIACWVLGGIAFLQLLVAGMALAARFEATRQVRVLVKEVTKWVMVPAPAKPAASAEAVVAYPPAEPSVAGVSAPPALAVLPPPTPLPTPAMADPRSEQLLTEARQARVAGDMGLAIVKLEEARGRSPEEPNIQFELGLVHEAMGVFDIATEHYEKVFQMGVAGAGLLYGRAAEKLRDGFESEVLLGKLALGRVRIFNDPHDDAGQRVVLTIPVQKAPGVDIELKDLSLSVEFFNRSTRDGIVPLEDKSWVTEKWTSERFEWVDGEETLRMTYVIPKLDQATEHLFGERTYYGQVVSLLYNGELLDVQAWPRDLAARSRQKVATAPDSPRVPEFLDKDSLPPNFDPNQPMVLPPR